MIAGLGQRAARADLHPRWVQAEDESCCRTMWAFVGACPVRVSAGEIAPLVRVSFGGGATDARLTFSARPSSSTAALCSVTTSMPVAPSTAAAYRARLYWASAMRSHSPARAKIGRTSTPAGANAGGTISGLR
jgi:hypothetical protein